MFQNTMYFVTERNSYHDTTIKDKNDKEFTEIVA